MRHHQQPVPETTIAWLKEQINHSPPPEYPRNAEAILRLWTASLKDLRQIDISESQASFQDFKIYEVKTMKVAKITPRITSHRWQGIKEFLQHEAVLLHKAPHEDHPQHFSGEAASLGVTRFGGSVSSDLRRIYDNPQEKFRRTG